MQYYCRLTEPPFLEPNPYVLGLLKVIMPTGAEP